MCKDPRPGCWSKHYHRIVPRDIADAIWLVESAGVGKVSLGGGWYRDLSAVEHPGDHSDIDLVVTDVDIDALDAWLAEMDEVEGKRSGRKRAFVYRTILVELHLVETRREA